LDFIVKPWKGCGQGAFNNGFQGDEVTVSMAKGGEAAVLIAPEAFTILHHFVKSYYI
jgi:hypothetical protein